MAHSLHSIVFPESGARGSSCRVALSDVLHAPVFDFAPCVPRFVGIGPKVLSLLVTCFLALVAPGSLGQASPGELDTTFNGTGKVTTPVGNCIGYGESVALLSDGRIVLAGSSSNSSNLDFTVVCYTSTGALDTSFNGT
ncbi:MAG: delta-60 repeat domain-containing protein, partial [Chthoniobacteraceae bacterium]